jgi:hypothetical protein
MKRYLATESEAFELLYSVMLYVGSLFAPSIPSGPLKSTAEHKLVTARLQDLTVTPFDIQAVMLYSIAAYGCDELDKLKELFNWVIRMALARGMNRSGFAAEHGRQDPILEESWRRTWWQIYITDAIIAGTTHTYPHRMSSVDVDVYLPCDERSYELGVSPSPTTLQSPQTISLDFFASRRSHGQERSRSMRPESLLEVKAKNFHLSQSSWA